MEERKDTTNMPDDAMNMEESLAYATAVDPRPGDIIAGHVVHIAHDSVLVDVGAKSEGIIHSRDLTYRKFDHPSDVVQRGDTIKVYVIGFEGDDGVLKLSHRRVEEDDAWERLEIAERAGEVIDASVVEVVKGGLVVDVGLRGFVPASHIDTMFVKDLSPYVGRTLRLKIIEIDRGKRRAVLSHRVVVDRDRHQDRQKIWNAITVGEVRQGVVKSLSDFGAFVDLGGIDGLLHVSEMAWTRIKHPSEILEIGQDVRVKVLSLDPEKGKISLGLKQITENPWDTVESRYLPGQVLEGRVVRLAPFGAFVELEPGIDGLVHISQLSGDHVKTPGDVVSIGQKVSVKVLSSDGAKRRIGLTMRNVSDGEISTAHQYRDESATGGTIGERIEGSENSRE